LPDSERRAPGGAFFDDFKLRPVPTAPELIQLEYQQRDSDYPFLAHQLSDGTLRFICLATALLEPVRPGTMLFDEPELGLHPYALTLLGNPFKATAEKYGSHASKQLRSDSGQVVVDGQTEESLIPDVLAPRLTELQIYLVPILLGVSGYKGDR
jgi:hypothetical protein